MFTDMPKVSIITPVYGLIASGREAYFRQLVESVHTQTYGAEHIEHIIIDGSSTDGTIELIKEYADKGYFAHWMSEKDTGIYNAMNKGALVSQGQYLMFVNSDDYLLPDGIKDSVTTLQKAYADYSIGDVCVEFTHTKRKKTPQKILHASIERIVLCYNPCHQGLMIRRDVFMECGMFDEKYKIAADLAQILDLYMKGKKCAVLRKSVAVIRDGGVSWMQQEQAVKERVDIAMRCYGNALNLRCDEVRFLISDGTDTWFIKEKRKKLYAILTKIQKQAHVTQQIKLSQELYFAILSLVFDDASGRDKKKMSMSHLVDSVSARSKHLPYKRRYAFLCAAFAKKIKLYWLIKPIRNSIVAYYERKH